MKPNFFIIGAPNSGTTSLWYLLKQHNEIFMPEIKEPRFFSRQDYNENWKEYIKLFQDVSNEKAIGEASVNYSETHIWPEIPSRVATHIPKAKIIYIVRHPLRRIESCWKQALSSGHWKKIFYTEQLMSLDFSEAVRSYPHLLGTTRYWTHLDNFRKYFCDNQIHVIFFEDFINNTGYELKKCCNFLKVDSDFKFRDINKPINSAKNKKMDRFLLYNIKKKNIIEKVKKIIPRRIRVEIYNNLIKKSVPQNVHWNEEIKKWVLEQLYCDIKSILRYGSKPNDFWKFD